MMSFRLVVGLPSFNLIRGSYIVVECTQLLEYSLYTCPYDLHLIPCAECEVTFIFVLFLSAVSLLLELRPAVGSGALAFNWL